MQTTVVMFLVVPGEEFRAPAPCVIHVDEVFWIAWLGFQCFKMRFRERIVVADARPGMTDIDLQFCKQINKIIRGHRRTPILMHGQRVLDNLMVRNRRTHEMSPRTSIEPPTDRVNRATYSFAGGSNMLQILALFWCVYGGCFGSDFGLGSRVWRAQGAPAFPF